MTKMGAWPTTAPSTPGASRTPRATGPSRPASSTGSGSRSRSSTTSHPPFYRWFPDATLNTCYNALDRHVVARARRPHRADLRQRRRRHRGGPSPTPQLLERGRRVRRCAARGFGVGAGDRVVIYMPMIPEAVDRDAGLRAARRRALGGLRRLRAARARGPHRRRPAQGGRGRVVRHRADPGGGVQADRRPGPRARRAPARRGRSSSSGRRPRRRCVEPRDVDWDVGDEGRRAPTRPSASRSRPPTRSTCSTPPAPPASRRASSATTAATRSRWRGRCRTSTTCTPGQVWWTASDVGWVVGHSYIVYAPLINGATTVLYEGKPVGTPDAGAFWRVIAEHGVEALFTAPTAIRAIKKEDPDGTLLRRARPQPASARCSWPGSGSTPRPTTGPPSGSASRSSTTGGRPRPAGRSPRTCAASTRCRSSRARRRCRCRATRSRSSTSGARRSRRARRARSACGCRCRPGTLTDAVGRRRAVRLVVPLGLRGLLPLRRRRVRRRGRLPVRDGPHRRRHQRGRAPAVHRVDGGGARRAPGGRRVRRDRRRRRAEGPGAARLRGAEGGRRRRPGRARRASWSPWSATRSARSRRSRTSPSSAACRRPAAARSCARRCARSPTARTPPCPRRSRTPRCWTRCGRRCAASERALRR